MGYHSAIVINFLEAVKTENRKKKGVHDTKKRAPINTKIAGLDNVRSVLSSSSCKFFPEVEDATWEKPMDTKIQTIVIAVVPYNKSGFRPILSVVTRATITPSVFDIPRRINAAPLVDLFIPADIKTVGA